MDFMKVTFKTFLQVVRHDDCVRCSFVSVPTREQKITKSIWFLDKQVYDHFMFWIGAVSSCISWQNKHESCQALKELSPVIRETFTALSSSGIPNTGTHMQSAQANQGRHFQLYRRFCLKAIPSEQKSNPGGKCRPWLICSVYTG